MKHSYITQAACTAIVAMAATFTACTFEQEDYFDETASLRIQHTNEDIKNTLVSHSGAGENGWLIQYFVGGTSDYNFEGFNLFGRFYDSGKVTLSSDHRYLRNGNAGKYTEFDSNYEMLNEESCVLAFNTWNDVLSVFVDPVDPGSAPNVLSDDGEGMNGDDRLVMLSYGPDEMLFRGERHSARVYFSKLDRTPEQYIADVKTLKNYIASDLITDYYFTNGDETWYITGLKNGYFDILDRLDDPLSDVVRSCVFTPTGFMLQYNYTIGQDTCKVFSLAADSSCLVSGNIQVIPCWDTYLADRTTLWNLDQTKFTATQQQLYTQIAAALKVYNTNYELYDIALGKSTGGSSVKGLVLRFYTNAAKSRTNTCGLALSTARSSMGQISYTMADTPAKDANFTAIAKKATDLESLMTQFAQTLCGTYSVQPNNCFQPTSATYTPVSGGTAFRAYE